MQPPFTITPLIIDLIASISTHIGEIKAEFLIRPSPQLRKQNKIRTIHASLAIEGNTLTEDQITAIIENKRVFGPQKDIKEVINAVGVYDELDRLKSYSEKSFLLAHQKLMAGLAENPGKYRAGSVGIVKGSKVAHVAPPAAMVSALMKKLFDYVRSSDDPVLIKSCVFHYELEFIHPFTDGNGRMGRLWQTVMLKEKYPVFGYLPFESLIAKSQREYYRALSKSDQSGQSTHFIEYMLGIINQSLQDLLDHSGSKMNDAERLEYFLSTNPKEFSRKDYLKFFKNISTATASRDLKKAVESGWIVKKGDKNQARYSIKS